MKESIVLTEILKAPIEKVWAALTEIRQLRQWYFDIADFSLAKHQVFNFYEPGGENKYLHQGEILEVIPKEKLKYSWGYPELTKERTEVQWELKIIEQQTHITLTHIGLENFAELGEAFSLASFQEGWKTIVGGSLKTYVEN